MTSSELDPEQTQVWEGSFFRHEGKLRWRCSLCGEEGDGAFKMVSKVEGLKISDLSEVVCLVEAEHAVRCSGSVEIWEIHSRKYVGYSRSDVSFGRDGSPCLFVASTVPGGTGHYEELTFFKPDSKEDES